MRCNDPAPRGAESESTLRANVDAFSTVTLWPRCMVDVSDVNLTCHLPTLGLSNLRAPIVVSPIAMARLSSKLSCTCRSTRSTCDSGIIIARYTRDARCVYPFLVPDVDGMLVGGLERL